MSSNIESLILRRVAERHQNAVAQRLGVSESHLSRIMSNEHGIKLDQLGQFLNELGLTVIDAGDDGKTVTITQDKYHAMALLIRDGL